MKRNRRLSLDKETIRKLANLTDEERLRAVQGGYERACTKLEDCIPTRRNCPTMID
jgi:hypothetical protein